MLNLLIDSDEEESEEESERIRRRNGRVVKLGRSRRGGRGRYRFNWFIISESKSHRG